MTISENIGNIIDRQTDPLLPIPRICFVTESYHPVIGGAENHSKLLANILTQMGMNVIIITRHYDPSSPKIDLMDNIPVYRIPPINPGRWMKFGTMPYLYRELIRRKNEYDLIYVCGFKVLGIPALMAAHNTGKRCVLRAETNGEMSGEYVSAYRKIYLLEKMALKSWLGIRNPMLHKADSFVCISEMIARECIQYGIAADKIEKIPNGVDTSIFHPVTAADRFQLRERLGIPIDKTILVFTGRFIPGKGIMSLAKAWGSIAEKYPNTCLLMVGTGKGETGSCENEFRDYIISKKLNSRVIYTGWADNVNEYLQASDIFIFPTEFEGFGLSLVEAMLCGLPVIASSVGAIPEIIDHGENGMLVMPGDTEALEKMLAQLLDNPAKAKYLADNAHDSTYRKYSIQAVAELHYRLFQSTYNNQPLTRRLYC